MGHEWVPERYGQFGMSWLDESRLFAGRKVSDDAPGSSSCWVFAFIGVENAFSPFRSEVEARVAHSDAPGRSERSGEPEWSLRNGGCVGGLPCEDGNEGRGEIRKRVSAGMIEWKPRPICGSSVCRRFRLLIWSARNCSNAV